LSWLVKASQLAAGKASRWRDEERLRRGWTRAEAHPFGPKCFAGPSGRPPAPPGQPGSHRDAHLGWRAGPAGSSASTSGTRRRAGITARDLRADRLLAEAYATGGDPLRLTGLFGISDPTAIRYCAETGLRGYDDSQALEGAAGSAGRTESTSAST